MSKESIEEIVLLQSVFEELMQEKDSRGYILVKTDPDFIRHGFSAVGFEHKKVADSTSLDTKLAEGDAQLLINYAGKKIKAAPYIRYHTPLSQVINPEEIFHVLNATKSDFFFLFDNGGGLVNMLEEQDGLKRLKTIGYIGTVSGDFFKTEKLTLPYTREE